MPLLRKLGDSPYQGYAYGYPHKLAYRPLMPVLSLSELWQDEARDALFLYLHLPFCEMRCGFCNLFTTANPGDDLVEAYLSALRRQIAIVKKNLGDTARFSRMAIGGGTPTFLTPAQLDDLWLTVEANFTFAPDMPVSVEMSPGTVDSEKLHLLLAHGMTRASIGVQSFVEAETRQLGRPQKPSLVHHALELIRDSGVKVFNLDLIYGIEGQTSASWEESLKAALIYHPEEIYLYPLYIRPLTGLDRIGRKSQDESARRYREGRDFLIEHGYRQVSMRLFRAAHHPSNEGPEYCCQEDGMLGLGAGARSYTRQVHYSSEYAVGKSGVTEIIQNFCRQEDASFARADYGFVLNLDEQKRRYVLKSLLRADGLNFQDYQNYFQSEALHDFPQLHELLTLDWAHDENSTLKLLPAGLDHSDTIGPWLYSDAVNQLIQENTLR